MLYHVKWEIEIDAETHEEAAKIARKFQLDPTSSATFFDVSEYSGAGGIVTIELKP